MATVVTMPKLGLTMTEGTITNIAVKVGDEVKAGQTIMEFETNKIESPIEAPVDGYVLKIMAEEGKDYEIRSELLWIGEKGEEVPE